MKKRTPILLGILLLFSILFFMMKPIIIPHLIPTAFKLTTLIHEKENKNDCTCWSTVRLMEYHQSEMSFTYEASVIKIESMKALISSIWKMASNQETSFSQSLHKILDKNFKEWRSPLHQLPSSINNVTLEKTQKYHYHQLTEHYRYILSIIYDLSYLNLNTKNYHELSKKNIKELALLSSHLNSLLLKEAKESARKNKHNEIEMSDVQFALKKIHEQLELKNQADEQKKPSILYNVWLKKISKKIIKNKIKSLETYNASLWNKSNTKTTQAYLLSKIFQLDIKEEALNTMEKNFWENFKPLFYESDFQRMDTHQVSLVKNDQLSTSDLSYKILPFRQMVEKLINMLPITLNQNGDIKANLTLEENYYNDSEIISVRSHTLDAVRDTIIHWHLIQKINSTHRTSIIDPFALELLAERISEYFAILFTKTKESNTSLNEMLLKGNLLKNLITQISTVQSNWIPKDIVTSQNYFEETHSLPIIENKILEYFYGYYNGITTVDIDNDQDIDLLIPTDTGLFLGINDETQTYPLKKIFEISGTRINSVFAIDLNSDYLLDLIAITTTGLVFFEQKDQSFHITKEIPIERAFTICTNDIDNDNDLDFYLTRVANESPSLDGRNSFENQLFITTEENTIVKSRIPAIESKGFGLACGIIDVNNDDLKDIIVINDFGRDELFIQNETSFTNEAKKYQFDDAGSGMNLNIIDFNQDDYWDIYITMIDMFNKQISFELPLDSTHMPFTEYIQKTSTFIIGNQLYLGSKQQFIRKTADYFEPGQKGWGWGATFFDYDNDSLDDIYITNGHYVPPSPSKNKQTPESEKNIFMLNKKNQFLFSKSLSEESTMPHNSRAVSAADMNNDGNMDLVVRNYNKLIIYKNITKESNDWIKIKLIGLEKNTFSIGAIIELKTSKKIQKKIVLAENGYLTQEPYTKHFGLDNDPIESIKIIWPNKKETLLEKPIKPNQTLTIFYNKTISQKYNKTQRQ